MRNKRRVLYDEVEHDVNLERILIAVARESRLQSRNVLPSNSSASTTHTISNLTNDKYVLDLVALAVESLVQEVPVADVINLGNDTTNIHMDAGHTMYLNYTCHTVNISGCSLDDTVTVQNTFEIEKRNKKKERNRKSLLRRSLRRIHQQKHGDVSAHQL